MFSEIPHALQYFEFRKTVNNDIEITKARITITGTWRAVHTSCDEKSFRKPKPTTGCGVVDVLKVAFAKM